jgi:hypothetical protein
MKCIVPFFNRVGKIPVEMRIGNLTTFEGFVISKDVSMDDKIQGLDPLYEVGNLSGSLILRSLHKGSSLHALDIDINGITRRLIKDDIEGSEELKVSELYDSGSSPSFLKLSFLILSNRKRIVKASAFYMLNKFEDPFPLTMPDFDHMRSKRWSTGISKISDAYCKAWKAKQTDPRPHMDSLPPCWPSVPLTTDGKFPKNFGEFEMDGACNPQNPESCGTFHPGSASCYRSEVSLLSQISATMNKITNPFQTAPLSPRQQCCYSHQNRLVVGPPGLSYIKHF